MSIVLDGTNGISDVDGSASTPAIRGTDANTGIFFPAADTIAFAEGGTEVMRLDSSGNVGIGTSSPQQKLQVYSSAASGGQIQVTNASTGATSTDGVLFGYDGSNDVIINNQEATATKFYTSAVERMRIDSSGNVLVGTSGAIGKLGVVTPTSGYGFALQGRSSDGQSIMSSMDRSGTVYTGNLIFPEDGSIVFGRLNTGTNTERMRITSDGKLLFGTTTDFGANINTVVLSAGGIGMTIQANVNGNWAHEFRNASGTNVGTIVINAGGTAYNTTSDYRLKENIAPMTGALDKVAQLKPVTYNWKVDGSAGQGFIAHELQAVVPDCVTGEKDAVDKEGKPVYQGVDTSYLVATLTAAIQELKAITDAQATRIETLEAQNAAFEARLAALEAK